MEYGPQTHESSTPNRTRLDQTGLDETRLFRMWLFDSIGSDQTRSNLIVRLYWIGPDSNHTGLVHWTRLAQTRLESHRIHSDFDNWTERLEKKGTRWTRLAQTRLEAHRTHSDFDNWTERLKKKLQLFWSRWWHPIHRTRHGTSLSLFSERGTKMYGLAGIVHDLHAPPSGHSSKRFNPLHQWNTSARGTMGSRWLIFYR